MNYYRQLSENTIFDLTTATSYQMKRNQINHGDTLRVYGLARGLIFYGKEANVLWDELKMLCSSAIYKSE